MQVSEMGRALGVGHGPHAKAHSNSANRYSRVRACAQGLRRAGCADAHTSAQMHMRANARAHTQVWWVYAHALACITSSLQNAGDRGESNA
jgi:hypothetical protein